MLNGSNSHYSTSSFYAIMIFFFTCFKSSFNLSIFLAYYVQIMEISVEEITIFY